MSALNATQLLERLQAIVGERGLVADTREQQPYVNDWRDLWHGRAAAVVRPASTEEVARVVTLLAVLDSAWIAAAGNGTVLVLLAVLAWRDSARAAGAWHEGMTQVESGAQTGGLAR